MKINMAASIVRYYIQTSLSRQAIGIVWRDQNVNSILHIFGIQYHCYHFTPAFLKKKKTVEEKMYTSFNESMLNDLSIEDDKKKESLPLIKVWESMSIKELADSANRDVEDVLAVLYYTGEGNIYNQKSILRDRSSIIKIVKYLGGKTNFISKLSKNKQIRDKISITQIPPEESQLVRRQPVVTIMGHVDHGKTTLLDALRNTSVVQSEFGGITQHIGAFDVTLESGDKVTFLDTPGHAAFTAMRYRGAHITDIVVLIVAADDGVKEQTLQSIQMAKDAKVPIIVAINKIDKPNINIKKVQNELAKHDIVVEELGGEVQCVKISALKRTNLNELAEVIVLQAELMDLRGDPSALVEAVAIECRNDIGRGKLVTALIKRGTLKKGCLLVSGLTSAKVRAMFNDSGQLVREAKLAEAVQIIGWKALPDVGSEIQEVKNDKILQEILKFREKENDEMLAKEHKAGANKKLEEHLIEYKKILRVKQLFMKNKKLMRQIVSKMRKQERHNIENYNLAVNVIIKGDVAGSVETLLDVFDTYKGDTVCELNVIHYGVGPVTISDVGLAETFNAIIYGFNINVLNEAKEEANNKGISIRLYNVVYKLIDNIKEEIYRVLPEIEVEEILGEAKVLQKFDIKEKKKKIGIAGCQCIKGVLLKSEMFHVKRNHEIIYSGKIVSMRHLKEEMSRVEVNYECGLRFEDPTISFQPGDTIVCFKVVTQKQKIEWDPGF